MLVAGTLLGIAISTSGRVETTAAAASNTSAVPFNPQSYAMKDYRGWTMEGAISDLDSLGLTMSLEDQSSANQRERRRWQR
ncbi:hypothetical protein LQ327_00215 [Actinomycetospora endophytica]|uniref:Uncharacterized protein n=1 Tax=Actinomycetospora endophytica TaxID=2291215 RepID=A0ABS8P0P4_9PSEU|nr:hypothetical protein [Actinomycetospora endophytica]MCD2191815.1 hypothetical protein [Actinomycetospora endophytica]